jgi:hypothetical protein
MKDDLLRAAARALAEETSGASEADKLTRARVLASLHQSRVKRRTRMAFVLPLAASFAAATAWGTVDGRAPALVRSVVELLGFRAAPKAPELESGKARTRAVPLNRASRPTSASDLAPPSPPSSAPTPGANAAPLAAGTRGPSSGEAVATGSTSETASKGTAVAKASSARERAAVDPSLAHNHALYLAAHRAHFVDHDFARAVVAWDAYLSAAPKGQFAPEARYNRALCLARLGRNAEASAALSPFAEAPLGGYRKQEASALRAALAE